MTTVYIVLHALPGLELQVSGFRVQGLQGQLDAVGLTQQELEGWAVAQLRPPCRLLVGAPQVAEQLGKAVDACDQVDCV